MLKISVYLDLAINFERVVFLLFNIFIEKMNDSQANCDNELLNGHNFSSGKQGEAESMMNIENSSEIEETKRISNGCSSNDTKSDGLVRDAVNSAE